MHLHFERTINAKSDCSILSLSWMGKVPDELPEDEGWKLNRTNYYQEGWLASGNIRGIVGVTFTTSHCKKNVDFPLRTNYNLRGHRSEVILVKWNEPYQKLASCDSSGIIFVWIKYEGRWSIELINDRNTPVTHFSWSHDGRMALICYQDGFVLVGSVAGQRYWSSMLNLEATITCGIWTPDDQQVYFGTTSGQIIVMDVHGAMVSQVQLCADIAISAMAWSCEKFKMEEGDDNDPGVTNAAERKFVLAVSLQNGFIYLLKTFDDVSPIQINTALQGPVCMEWSNSRELLAVAGVTLDGRCSGSSGGGSSGGSGSGSGTGGITGNFHNPLEFINMLKFYNEKGTLLYTIVVPFTQAPVSALTWGHNDKRLFLATGTQIHIAWVSRRIATLQLLCRLTIHESVNHESRISVLPLPARIRNLIGNLFAQTIRCCVPDSSALREFVSRPPIGSVRLHCTMIRHDEDNHLSSGTCYTLYLEYLGGLVPLLKGKRTSKIRPEFVIFDPQIEDCNLHQPTVNLMQWSPETKSSGSSSQSTSGGNLASESSDSDLDDGCTGSPRLQRRRKKRNKSRSRAAQPVDGEQEDLAYVDTLPEHVRLVEVTSNIWGTKFKIHGLVNSVPANLGQVTYKTSLLHLQPRQMTLVMTELRDDFPICPDPNFNPNLFSEDEEDSNSSHHAAAEEKSRLMKRVSIDKSPPIAPMSPRSQHHHKLSTKQSKQLTIPVLAQAESIEDLLGQQREAATRSSTSTSFVGSAQRHHAAVSPLYCDSAVPSLQSPKNAVAPSDIIFERPPPIGYNNGSPSSGEMQVKPANYEQSCSKTSHESKVNNKTISDQKSPNHFKELMFIDEEHQSQHIVEVTPGPSTDLGLKFCLADSMVRSCSVGYLDMVDVQIIPNEVTLSILRKDAPKRLVLVNNKNKQRKHQRKTNERFARCNNINQTSGSVADAKTTPNLKSCGKSKSLDSSDIFHGNGEVVVSGNVTTGGGGGGGGEAATRAATKLVVKEINAENTAKSAVNTEEIIPILGSNVNNNNSNMASINNNNNKKESKLSFFVSRSPLMRRKKADLENNLNNSPEIGKNRGRSKQKKSPLEGSTSLHSQALATLESLLTRLKEDDGGGGRTGGGNNTATPTPAPSPKLPRSSPCSPAPSKKGKRPQSASPVRKALMNSPLLGGRRNKKNKSVLESSDDEVNASGDDVVCTNSTNYKDLETFQKAQLRQKLKRSKIEPNGSNVLTIPQRREFVMHNKAPMWNENSQVYQLDFGGRVTQESAKNFQIEFRGKQVMQFGRIDGNAYTLDFQYPFSALQAFAVALANVTQRLK